MKESLPFLAFLFSAVGIVVGQVNYEPYEVRTLAPTINGDPIGSHATLNAMDVAFDANGNLFVADNTSIRKIAPNGAVTTVATGFNHPAGLVFDSAGTLYLSDTNNNAIRKVLPDGSVRLVAGVLTPNAASVDGPADQARFGYPTGIAIDAKGFLYVADQWNGTIRKIAPDGFVTTLAGLAGNRDPVDGQGSAARFSNPLGVAVDALENVYVTDSNCVRKITPDGTVTTIAGVLGQWGYAEGKGSEARFGLVHGITISPQGYLCVVDAGNGRIRKVTADATVSTIAGGYPALGLPDPSWFDGVGSEARFGYINGIEVDGTGNLYVAQGNGYSGLGQIRKVAPDGVVTTLPAGTLFGIEGQPDDTGAIPPMGSVKDLAVDSLGNLYVADFNRTCIHKITPRGVISTVRPMAVRSDGKRILTPIYPTCVAVDLAGNIYFFEYGGLGKITPDGSLTLFAGDQIYSGSADGIGNKARFSSPSRMAFDKQGNLYVADTKNCTIRKITPGAVVTTLAGSPREAGIADGQGSAARFAEPMGVAADSAGNVYVADTMYVAKSNTIRKITPDGVVTTLAGLAGNVGHVDGVGPAARFHYPTSVVTDRAGNVFVGDSWNMALRKITPSATVTTLAGSTNSAVFGADGIGSAAGFFGINGIAADSVGNLYVADAQKIRVASPTLKARSLNVSTRLQVLEGENVLIGGFIVGGSSTKKVIIRAVGPSLAAYSVTGVLSDPAVELHDASGALIGSNDNWRLNSQTQQSQEMAIAETGLQPSNERESAVVATLDPGEAYTVVVHGAHGEKGVASVEVYDLSSTNAAALANISTRGFVESGDKVMIAGFILGGNTSKGEVVIRALGPSLGQSGITNPLANPTLQLFDANGQVLASNDDWNDTNGAAVQSIGLQPPSSLDSAIRIVLPAGAYTAVVGGHGGSGVGLVEVYNLP